jgi:hypothetical protein
VVSPLPKLLLKSSSSWCLMTGLFLPIRMLATYSDVTLPEVGEYGQEYARFLTETAARSLPAFACHYYNHYFAHTAGGRMIGKKMAAMLLDGIELNFYKVRDLSL